VSVADPIARLVKELARLPGIGEKTAQRLAFHVLEAGSGYATALAEAIVGVVRDVRLCSTCQTLTDRDPCSICADPKRDARTLCVVESVPDLLAVERTHEFRGRYHVLHGALSPLEGVGPGDLKIRELLVRLAGGRDRPGHQPGRRGRGDGAVSPEAPEAPRDSRHAHRPRCSHGRGSRIR
jgi:recombination protein RecR